MWQIILGAGFLFLLLEIFLPGFFFLNFAFAAFLVAILSVFVHDIFTLTIIFSILSVLFIYCLRPVLLKYTEKNLTKTGMDEKYVGQFATVIEPIDANSGVISIYDERWQARTIDNTRIDVNSRVKIVSYQSLIMNVEKVD